MHFAAANTTENYRFRVSWSIFNILLCSASIAQLGITWQSYFVLQV